MTSNADIRKELVARWKRKWHCHWCKFRTKECTCKPKVQEACAKLRSESWIQWNLTALKVR